MRGLVRKAKAACKSTRQKDKAVSTEDRDEDTTAAEDTVELDGMSNRTGTAEIPSLSKAIGDRDMPQSKEATLLDYDAQERCRESIVRTLSWLYAMLLVILGLVFPMTFFLSGRNRDSGAYLSVFHIYIYLAGLVFLIYVHVTVSYQKRKLRSFETRGKAPGSRDRDVVENGQIPYGNSDMGGTDIRCICRELETGADTEGENFCRAHMSPRLQRRGTLGTMERLTLDGVEPEDLPFYFAEEGINFFLRLGAIFFGMGSIVLDGFRLVQFAQSETAWECYGLLFVVHTSLRLLYVFCLTFFIFKNHKIVLNFNKPLIKLGLLHTMATNMCIWCITLVLEATESYSHLQSSHLEADVSGYAHVNGSAMLTTEHQDVKLGNSRLSSICHEEQTLADRAAPYLYPCVIEFTLISSAIVFRMYKNMGTPSMSFATYEDDKYKQGIECQKATTGLFLGLFVFTLTTIGACFFLLYDITINPLTSHVTLLVYVTSDIGVNVMATLCALGAFLKIRQLYFMEDWEHQFDAGLLLISLGGFFGLSAFMAVPAVTQVDAEDITGLQAKFQCTMSILSFVEAIVQTLFIMDALRRRAVDSHQTKSKPGRSLVTFLLICNLALWLVDTFELKEATTSGLFVNFYGSAAWIIIMHCALPLTVCFRFLSTICLSEIWANAFRRRRPEFTRLSI